MHWICMKINTFKPYINKLSYDTFMGRIYQIVYLRTV